MSKTILIIDDEAMVLDALTVILEDLDYTVEGYSDPFVGEQAALSGDYDLILSDLRMPGKNGAEIVKSILAAKPKARVLIITAFPSDPLAEKALSSGALGLVRKPFEISKIIEYLEAE
ncbi:MAG TPA: response regulator [Spirochaetia bacterium]|nr:response regulator [Spirochaetia bacterium]